MLELHYTRRSRRRAIDLPVELIRRDWDEPVNHRVTDISAVGVFIRTTFPMSLGEQVVLSFTPPGGRDPLQVFAQVTRVVRGKRGPQPTGMGLAFMDLSRGDRSALTRRLRVLPGERKRQGGIKLG